MRGLQCYISFLLLVCAYCQITTVYKKDCQDNRNCPGVALGKSGARFLLAAAQAAGALGKAVNAAGTYLATNSAENLASSLTLSTASSTLAIQTSSFSTIDSTVRAAGTATATTISSLASTQNVLVSTEAASISVLRTYVMRVPLLLLVLLFHYSVSQQNNAGIDVTTANAVRSVAHSTSAAVSSTRSSSTLHAVTGSSSVSSASAQASSSSTKVSSLAATASTSQSTSGGVLVPPKICSGAFYTCKEVVSTSPREHYIGTHTYGLWNEYDANARVITTNYGILDAATRKVTTGVILGPLSLLPSQPNGCSYESEDLLDSYLDLLCSNETGSSIIPLASSLETTATSYLQCPNPQPAPSGSLFLFWRQSTSSLQAWIYIFDVITNGGVFVQGALFQMPIEASKGFSYINAYYGEKLYIKFIDLFCNSGIRFAYSGSNFQSGQITATLRLFVDEMFSAKSEFTIWTQTTSAGYVEVIVNGTSTNSEFSVSGVNGQKVVLYSEYQSYHVGESIYHAINVMLDKALVFAKPGGAFFRACGPFSCKF